MSQLSFLICTEKGILENQSRILVSSIRRFGGALKDCPIYSFQPRKSKKVSEETIKFFEQNNVTLIDRELNKSYKFYPLANKVLACAWAEENVESEILVFLDSDVAVLGEPLEFTNLNNADARLRPVDIKGIGSDVKGDPAWPFWKKLYHAYNISSYKYVETTVDQENILAYWNAGHIVARRSSGLFNSWKQTLDKMLADKTLPPSGLFFMDQISLAIAISSLNLKVDQLPPAYNYPLHLHEKMLQQGIALQPAKVVSFHYHDVFGTGQYPVCLEDFLTYQEKGIWLANILKKYDLKLPVHQKIMGRLRSYKNNLVFKYL